MFVDARDAKKHIHYVLIRSEYWCCFNWPGNDQMTLNLGEGKVGAQKQSSSADLELCGMCEQGFKGGGHALGENVCRVKLVSQRQRILKVVPKFDLIHRQSRAKTKFNNWISCMLHYVISIVMHFMKFYVAHAVCEDSAWSPTPSQIPNSDFSYIAVGCCLYCSFVLCVTSSTHRRVHWDIKNGSCACRRKLFQPHVHSVWNS